MEFQKAYRHKFIYVFAIDDEAHKGMLKIGESTVEGEYTIDKLFENCAILNKLANERIKSYTNTAGVEFQLLHTQLALIQVQNEDGTIVCKGFRDYDVHKVLQNSDYSKKTVGNTTGSEWFSVEIDVVRSAIDCVKRGQACLDVSQMKSSQSTIIFRPEQQIAIERTLKQFKYGNKMLWNAKMRFGKTLTALEVAKRMNVKKGIIVTHRPVVSEGWFTDFRNIFYNSDQFAFGCKSNSMTIEQLLDSQKQFIYFASVQDLRGSDLVGGKFDKNQAVFDQDWDLVVVDEAHEGTTTSLGEKVISKLLKKNSKFLALSGTPFHILKEYREEELFVWDYKMEQEAKHKWDQTHCGDSNPYADLPRLHIYTYNLGALTNKYQEISDKAFHFREFFRTWSGVFDSDYRAVPSSQEVGDFVHEEDILHFLDLITTESENSQYPYATDENRNLFQHALWMIPGVKEARALSKLLKAHPIFGSAFDIINVAGDGDFDEASQEALQMVQNGIAAASAMCRHSITLSCGKLTTGVTIPQWTAVFMLSGSYNTSASSYLQTIFRVQSPGQIEGKRKENCFVFDFAPDRTLKMIAESVSISSKAGKTTSSDRVLMGEFLNFCPVIALDGTKMERYNEDRLLQQLKKAYAERAVRSGFDDNSIYNHDALGKLTEEQLKQFAELKKIVGSNQATPSGEDIIINDTGMDQEDHRGKGKKSLKERPTVDEALGQKRKEEQKKRETAISNLRAVSIRIPLLIYGADVDFDESITAEQLVKMVDNQSWEEFMPHLVTKKMFRSFIKFYDPDVFIEAGRRIRAIAKEADLLPPTERVQKITELFTSFKNPDKETVLTPWRAVNHHLVDCLGGYSFFNDDFSEPLPEPKLIDKVEITQKTLQNSSAKILEINSKTGLYPLFLTYSLFRSKCPDPSVVDFETQNRLWTETVEENIYVICKTPMAKSITKRTLLGYQEGVIHSHHVENLIDMLKNEPDKVVAMITKSNFWEKKGSEKLNFQAIVGNPPYQIMDNGSKASASPIYQYFVQAAKNANPEFVSFILPCRWFSGGKGLDEFRNQMLNDNHIREIHDYITPVEIFPHTNIRGGVCYFLWDKNHNNLEDLMRLVSHKKNVVEADALRPLKSDLTHIFLRDPYIMKMLPKILKHGDTLNTYTTARNPFQFSTSFTKAKGFRKTSKGLKNPVKCYGKGQVVGFVERDEVKKNVDFIDSWKVFMSASNNVGTELSDDNINTFVGGPQTICTDTYIAVGVEMNLGEESAKNLSKYYRTKFLRYLLSARKGSQHASKETYQFVPKLDFSSNSDIDWSQSISDIDKQLYQMFGLTDEERSWIEGKIKAMG